MMNNHVFILQHVFKNLLLAPGGVHVCVYRRAGTVAELLAKHRRDETCPS
jgi:hypothetical protein